MTFCYAFERIGRIEKRKKYGKELYNWFCVLIFVFIDEYVQYTVLNVLHCIFNYFRYINFFFLLKFLIYRTIVRNHTCR